MTQPKPKLTMPDLLRGLAQLSHNIRLLAKAQMPTHLSLQREQIMLEEAWLAEAERIEARDAAAATKQPTREEAK